MQPPLERAPRARTVVLLTVLGMFLASGTIVGSCLGGVYIFMQGGKEKTSSTAGDPKDPPETLVLVAVNDIPAGALLAQPEILFEVKSVPKKTEPDDAVADLDVLRGRVLVRKLTAGQPCRRRDLDPSDAYVVRLPAELRAMGVRVVGDDGNRFLLPGCRVDVLARERTGHDKIRHQVLLENILVLSVSRRELPGGEEKGSEPVPSATLAVTPEQATKLADALGEAPVRLIVRLPEAKPAQ